MYKKNTNLYKKNTNLSKKDKWSKSAQNYRQNNTNTSKASQNSNLRAIWNLWTLKDVSKKLNFTDLSHCIFSPPPFQIHRCTNLPSLATLAPIFFLSHSAPQKISLRSPLAIFAVIISLFSECIFSPMKKNQSCHHIFWIKKSAGEKVEKW